MLDLKDHERALVWIENRFSHLLPSGLYEYWTEQKNVRVELVDARELDTFLTDKDAVTKSIGTIECRMDIHVRRMANISDMNVQGTGIAAMDRASGTRPVSISHSGFGHNALNFHGRMPRLRFDRMSSSESPLQSIGLR